jgi:hypothetical protein
VIDAPQACRAADAARTSLLPGEGGGELPTLFFLLTPPKTSNATVYVIDSVLMSKS